MKIVKKKKEEKHFVYKINSFATCKKTRVSSLQVERKNCQDLKVDYYHFVQVFCQ